MSTRRARRQPVRRAARRALTRLELERLEGRCLPSGTPGPSALGRLPLAFEPNVGQADPSAGFVSHGAGYTLALSPTRAVLGLRGTAKTDDPTVLAVQLVGANANAPAAALDRLAGVSNYFFGNDPNRWHTGVPNFGRVSYQNVYPGVDLVYYGNGGRLEYDFVVAPGAGPGPIRFTVSGARGVALDAQGNLVLHTAGGDVTEQAPALYQVVNGVRRAVAGRYVLGTHGQVGFAVGAYDPRLPLVIDPVLSFSSYFAAGTGAAVAVDSLGYTYFTGDTPGTGFPTAHPIQGGYAGGLDDAFVAKLNPAGTALVYSTFLGGNNADNGTGIAVDAAGNVYVTGNTTSVTFPTVAPFQTALAGSDDVFVTKLNAAGNAIAYSTYLGGSGGDFSSGLAVDAAGNAVVAGAAGSTNFPTVNALQAHNRGSGATPQNAFVAKFTPAGQVVYSTYLGGTATDDALGVTEDSTGNAYVGGETMSTDFPTTAGAFQTTNHGSLDGFVTKINPTGSALVYSTYLGGSVDDELFGIAVDPFGEAYVAGSTQSTDFPVANAFQPHTPAGFNGDIGFVSKFNPAGGLVYSTYLGGSSFADFAYAIAADSWGDAYVTGETSSTDFPVLSPVQPAYGGGPFDAFVTKFNPSGTPTFSTVLGGGARDTGDAIAVDPTGTIYVEGTTDSSNFPTAFPFQPTAPGTQNTFITKIAPDQPGIQAVLDHGVPVVFDLTPADYLYRYTFGVGWQLLGGGLTSISAVTDAAGKTVVFAVAENGGLARFDAATGWQWLGPAGTAQAVSAGLDAGGQADAFVVTPGHGLLEWRGSSGWLPSPVGGNGTILQAAAFRGDRVAALLANHAVYEYDPRLGWFALTGPNFAQALSGVVDAAGQEVLYAIGLDRALYGHTFAGGWKVLGAPGTVVSISAGTDTAGQADVVVLTTGGALAEDDTVSGWSLLNPPGTVFDFSATASDQTYVVLTDGSVLGHDKNFGWFRLTGPGFGR